MTDLLSVRNGAAPFTFRGGNTSAEGEAMDNDGSNEGVAELDLSLVRVIIQDALKVTEDLDGAELEDGDVNAKRRQAVLNRRLLNLADQLQLASALVRNDYWNGKGLMSYDV